jgi:hypothetical protein
MILKHFIVRSQRHAIEKYLGRKYAEAGLAKGWHGNRLGLTAEMLTIPESSPFLNTLETTRSSPATLLRPVKKHFWHW